MRMQLMSSLLPSYPSSPWTSATGSGVSVGNSAPPSAGTRLAPPPSDSLFHPWPGPVGNRALTGAPMVSLSLLMRSRCNDESTEPFASFDRTGCCLSPTCVMQAVHGSHSPPSPELFELINAGTITTSLPFNKQSNLRYCTQICPVQARPLLMASSSLGPGQSRDTDQGGTSRALLTVLWRASPTSPTTALWTTATCVIMALLTTS